MLDAHKAVPGSGKVIQAYRDDRCVRGLVSVFVLESERVIFFCVWTRGPLKKTDIHRHTRTARQQVGGNLCLFVRLCYHLLFPVKTGKDRGENGG